MQFSLRLLERLENPTTSQWEEEVNVKIHRDWFQIFEVHSVAEN